MAQLLPRYRFERDEEERELARIILETDEALSAAGATAAGDHAVFADCQQ